MPDAFVPLAEFLQPSTPGSIDEPPERPRSEPVVEDFEAAVRAARRFRAALSDALEAALPELLRAIAGEVLGRELRLGGSEIAAIVAHALDRAGRENVVAIRVHPRDVDTVAGIGLVPIADDALAQGDCRIELRSGTIDCSLAMRLDAALAART